MGRTKGQHLGYPTAHPTSTPCTHLAFSSIIADRVNILEGEIMESAPLDVIAQLRRDLGEIWRLVQQDNDTTTGFRRADRWHQRAVRVLRENVSPVEAQRLQEAAQGSFQVGNPLANLREMLKRFDAELVSLAEEIERDPLHLAREEEAEPNDEEGSVEPNPRKVFIVHGHDETNTLRLRNLLRERFGLEPVIMAAAAGGGRTLIEKFEQLAQDCSFAFVLLTPDDQVATGSGDYTQARPNVIFELGWFYGRIGRGNVVMLLKEGTHIHSDLDGVSRIQFRENIEDKLLEIERELHTLLHRVRDS